MLEPSPSHPQATPPALTVRELRFSYLRPHKPALDGVDLTVPAGQIVALLGPNGSGKTTLLKLICGLLRPDTGTIEVFGSAQRAAIRREIGVVFSSNGLDRHLTVLENLRDHAAFYGLPRAEAKSSIDAELARSGLTERRHDLVKTLSHGLARRADLARALLHQPKLLLLDEPTTGLDPTARTGFLDELGRGCRERGLTVLMSTHLVDEADRCDRVVLLHRGDIVADDAPDTLRRQLGAQRVTVLTTENNPPSLAGSWQRSARSWTMSLDDDTAAAQAVAAELTAAGVPFSIAPPTLADVFEQRTGSRLSAAGVEMEAEQAP